ncbi:uncharacterized protein Z519_04863 [Cladophialophora bantiana CBS 173.52]|uniref:Uncharacterized protein n=1 Tax=Cladophialophora bantiana (strain ATCC 10958 / CBS 173.52 / CDC B-1940 / NIH 8579) TaxID=1442370 RepID=A0A0D2HVH7_CLAB1|nr:uncharacterized protein Z519_04863 [Cladophialophora bantiana CBS 173.52]KIW94885.1 hypothetical protein Z519_04863 [Cladophialophora bantiana CBS 173.52]
MSPPQDDGREAPPAALQMLQLSEQAFGLEPSACIVTRMLLFVDWKLRFQLIGLLYHATVLSDVSSTFQGRRPSSRSSSTACRMWGVRTQIQSINIILLQGISFLVYLIFALPDAPLHGLADVSTSPGSPLSALSIGRIPHEGRQRRHCIGTGAISSPHMRDAGKRWAKVGRVAD